MIENFKFEPNSGTVRSVPENYWLATIDASKNLKFDSWDGAVRSQSGSFEDKLIQFCLDHGHIVLGSTISLAGHTYRYAPDLNCGSYSPKGLSVFFNDSLKYVYNIDSDNKIFYYSRKAKK